MTMHMRPSRSINRISKWLVNWSMASIVTTFIFIVITSYQNVQFFITGEGKFLEGGPDFILGIIDGIIGFVALILMLYWFYRASKNVRAFGATGIASPVMAVVWWFVPFLNLWKPYQVTRNLWKASNPQLDVSSSNGISTGWRDFPSSNNIKLWWILGLLYFFVNIISRIVTSSLYYSDSEQTAQALTIIHEGIFYSNLFVIVADILFIFSIIFFIRVIKGVSMRQEIRGGYSI
jgi:Domain of unknown function (DUF4328)